MPLTLEWLYTDRQAFGITNATPAQRAICRVGDGSPLGELAHHPDVIECFGGEEFDGRGAIQALGEFEGCQPDQVDLFAAIRGGKSILASAAGVRCALTCDLSPTQPGERVVIPILSIKKEKAAAILNHLIRCFTQKPALRELLARKPNGDVVSIRRPQDGRVVDIVVTANARAGGAVVADWLACLIFDESPRMLGEDEGVINYDETRSAALGRILPGGQIWSVGSPWAARGPCYEDFVKRFGRPSPELVVISAPGPLLNPVWWTPARCEAMRKKPGGETAYTTDVLGRFADTESSMFGEAALRRCARHDLDAIYDPALQYGAAIDPATRVNAFTLAIVGIEQATIDEKRDALAKADAEARIVVARARQWQGSAEKPLKSPETFAEIAAELQQYGLDEALADRWGFDPFHDHAEAAGFTLILDERTETEKANGFTRLKNASEATPPRLEIPPDPFVRKDLLGTKKRLTPQGGMKPDFTKTADGRHCDYAPAIERARYAASTATRWGRAMDAVEKRDGQWVSSEPEPDEDFDADTLRRPRLCAECQINYYGPCPTHGRQAS